MSEWKLLEKGFPASTHVLLYCPDENPKIVSAYFFESKEWKGWLYTDEILQEMYPDGPNPTHWTPSIEPPSQNGE